MSGWGAMDTNQGANSQQLRRATVLIEPCTELPDPGNRVPDELTNICARGIQPNSGFCTSDTGELLNSVSIHSYKFNH